MEYKYMSVGDKMKEFEKYTIASLIGAIFFSLINMNVYVGSLIFLICVIFFVLDKKKVYYLFIGIPILIGSLLTLNKEVQIGSIYKAKVNIDKKIEIKSLNHKFLKNKYYLQNKFLENKIGNFEITLKINKIEEFNNIYYVNGEVTETKESYFNKYRNSIRKIIENTGYSYEVEAFTKAIVLGERGELSKELEENYRKVGATHVLSISGLHISIVIIGFIAILHYFSFNYRAKYIITLIVLTFYIGILGNNPAILRSYIMGAIYLLSKIFYEKSDIKKSFCISIIVIIFMNPNVIYDLSFIMSYSALFGIIYVYEKFKKENIYYNTFLVSLIIQIMLTPVTVYYFKTIAVYSFVFNIFIVIWGDILINLIFLGVFLESIKCGFILRKITEFFYDVLDIFIKTMSKLPMSSLEIDRDISIYFFILMIVLIFIALWDIKYSVYGILAGILIYNLLPYENLKTKNYYYFPKEKVLVVLDRDDKKLKSYKEKAKIIVGEKENLEISENKEYYEIKKGERVSIGQIIIDFKSEINCIYK